MEACRVRWLDPKTAGTHAPPLHTPRPSLRRCHLGQLSARPGPARPRAASEALRTDTLACPRQTLHRLRPPEPWNLSSNPAIQQCQVWRIIACSNKHHLHAACSYATHHATLYASRITLLLLLVPYIASTSARLSTIHLPHRTPLTSLSVPPRSGSSLLLAPPLRSSRPRRLPQRLQLLGRQTRYSRQGGHGEQGERTSGLTRNDWCCSNRLSTHGRPSHSQILPCYHHLIIHHYNQTQWSPRPVPHHGTRH